MMYIVRSHVKDEGKYVYVTVEPVLELETGDFPVTFAWTHARGEAVRFTTQWHASVVASALPNGGKVIEVVE